MMKVGWRFYVTDISLIQYVVAMNEKDNEMGIFTSNSSFWTIFVNYTICIYIMGWIF